MDIYSSARSLWDRAKFELSQRLDSQSPESQNITHSVSDAHQTANSHLRRLGATGQIKYGRVVYALPYLNWYRVLLAEEGDFPCCKLSSDTTLSPVGPRETSTLVPGTMVMVLKQPNIHYGFILGALPELVQSGGLVFSDWISQGANCGFKREGYFDELLTLLDDEGGAQDFSCNRPQDSTLLDWGRISDLGGLLHLDPFMLLMRMDEETGLQLHYLDRLARLAGHNLDVRTAAYELAARNDEGEYDSWSGETPYLHEAIGSLVYGTEVVKESSPTDVQYNQPVGALEPLHDDIQAFYRYREFGGYLGQGRMREMVVPPKDQTIQRYQDTNYTPTVFREHISLDGAYAVESAKSFLIAKRPFLPSPKQTRMPEDGTGDTPANYKAAGRFGSGDDHEVGDLTVPGSSGGPPDHVLTVESIRQYHAYAFNYKSLAGFHYHKRDWNLPEEIDSPLHSDYSKPDYSKLASQQWMDEPAVRTLKVDDRLGDVRYHQVLQHLHLTEEGGISIGDGFGAEIVLCGGSVSIRCPGDIMLMPGRSIIQQAGDDIVIKARNSVDISATDHDVRLKAAQNTQIVSVDGGILLESQASSITNEYDQKIGEEVISSGVVLKAPNSQIVSMGQELYLRTGVTTEDGPGIGGDIVIDANKGEANIKMVASQRVSHVDTILDYFGISQQLSANRYTSGSSHLFGTLEVDGSIQGTAGITCEDTITVTSGHIQTQEADGNDGKVAQLKSSVPQTQLEQVGNRSNTYKQDATKSWKQAIQQIFYEDGKIGSDDLQRKLSFSFRNEEQYRSTALQLVQAYWQKQIGTDGEFWTENPITYQSQQLGPWPGWKRWGEDSAFYRIEDKLYDDDAGTAKARSDQDYQDRTYGGWKDPQKADGNYAVI